jgi:hypothetical protein
MNRRVIRARLAANCGFGILLIALSYGSAYSAEEPKASGSRPSAPATTTEKKSEPRQVDWDALLPPDERNRLDGPPARPKHDYLGESGPAADQQGSMSVNPELKGAYVKVPGFIVPLDFSRDGLAREFFLVPYFGACVHVPPPPPNQVVYVKMAQPIKLGSMYDAFWVTGTMRTETKASSLGWAAYTLDATGIEQYKY